MKAADLPAFGSIDSDELASVIFPVDPHQVVCRAAPWLLERIWGAGIEAMTLGQTILLGRRQRGPDGVSASLLVHELVHARQWHEFGWFGFLRLYLGDYLEARRSGLTHREAYNAIGLEREARHLSALLAS